MLSEETTLVNTCLSEEVIEVVFCSRSFYLRKSSLAAEIGELVFAEGVEVAVWPAVKGDSEMSAVSAKAIEFGQVQAPDRNEANTV